MSTFNPDLFLQTTVNEANDTKVTPCPVGEYMATIDAVKPRQWQSKDGTSSGISLDVTWSIDDANAKAIVGRDDCLVKQGVMLDLTEQGQLDMGKGKNVGLGRLREATGTNVAGQPFSFTQLLGQSARVIVEHRVSGEDTFSEIKKVAKL